MIQVTCTNCNILFYKYKSQQRSKNNFCSHTCAASYNNAKRIQYTLCCTVCSKQLFRNSEQFCSHSCHQYYKHLEYIHNWKLELETGLSGKQVSSHIRRYLFKKYNNSCQKCKWSVVNKYTNRIPLTVHHIDGDYRNTKEENLQLLCPNCHTLTPNFGSRNTNKVSRYQ